MLRDLYLFIEVTRCHCVFKELRVSEPSMWEKSRCIYLKFFKVHRTVLKIGKKAKNGEYVELKKTLVVGIFQQLYIEKALSICFQGEKKKERKEKSPNPKLRHQPYTPLDTYIRPHTRTQKSERK